jgi:hypothetical protein
VRSTFQTGKVGFRKERKRTEGPWGRGACVRGIYSSGRVIGMYVLVRGTENTFNLRAVDMSNGASAWCQAKRALSGPPVERKSVMVFAGRNIVRCKGHDPANTPR